MPVSHDAEAPISDPTAHHADKVHDAVPSRAQFRPRNLAQDRHVVTVKETPANAEQNQSGHSQCKGVQ